jgi:hypothetical protein
MGCYNRVDSKPDVSLSPRKEVTRLLDEIRDGDTA